jgi:hypothetical protein
MESGHSTAHVQRPCTRAGASRPEEGCSCLRADRGEGASTCVTDGHCSFSFLWFVRGGIVIQVLLLCFFM